MAPAKVEVIVEQVVYSAERVANCEGRESEVLEIRRVAVTPYRSGDVSAKAVTLPYPFCAPAQSAVAIVSFKEIQKWQTATNAVQAYNEGINKGHQEDVEQFNADREAHHVKARELMVENARMAKEDKAKLAAWEDEVRGYEARLQAYRQSGSVGPAPAKPGKKPERREPEPILKFKKEPPVKKSHKPTPPALNQDTRHFVIGGGQLSAAAALTPHFQAMTRACIYTRSSPEEDDEAPNQNYAAKMEQHLQAVRALLHVQSNVYGVAVFEALMTGTPSPLSSYLAASEYDVDPETGEPVLSEQTEQAKQERIDRIKAAVGDNFWNVQPLGSQFVYDRVPLNDRFSTTTRMRVVVEITEHAAGPVRRIVVEPKRYDAIRAHAVYAGLRKDVDDLVVEMNEFVNCLFGLRADRGIAFRFVDETLDRLSRATNFSQRQLSKIFRLGGLFGRVRNDPIERGLDPEHVRAFVKELSLIMNLIVPIPEIPTQRQRQEELIRIERDVVQAEEIEFEEQLRLEIGNPDEEVEVGTPLTVEADRSDELNEALQLRTVVREMPQIVRAEQDLVAKIQFQKPVDTAAPDEFHIADQASVGGWMYLFSWVVRSIWLVWETDTRWEIFSQLAVGKGLVDIVASWGGILAGAAAEAAPAAAAAAGWIAAGFPAIGGPFLAAAAALAGIAAKAAAEAAADAAKELAKIAAKSAYEQVRAFSDAAPTAWWAGSMIQQWSQAANQLTEEKKAAYYRAIIAARGIPIETSLAAGKEALRQIRELVTRRSTALREAGGVTVLFDEASKERFRFFERYTVLPEQLQAVIDSQPAYDYEAWQRVPNSATLTLLPPADVLDTLFEVETLRSVPIGDAVKRVTGKSIALSSDQYVELSAETAFKEVFEYVLAARFPLAEFKGEQLLQNSEEVVLTILERAANIMKAAYGSQPGVTLIAGDDPLWSCLPSGVAARMALRHITTFNRADGAVQAAANGEERFTAAMEQWQLPQRSLIDAFANSLVSVAKKALKESSKPLARPFQNARGVVIEAVRSFARMNAMADASDKVPCLMAAAHYSGTLQVAFSSTSAAAAVLSIASSESVAAREFSDQKDMKFTVRESSTQVMNAAWASRRIDKNVMLAWKVAKTPAPGQNRVEDLITDLSGMGIQNEKRQYYVPFGVRLSGIPGTSPFDVHGMDRIVWLEPLKRALSSLALGVVSTPLPEGVPAIRGVRVSALDAAANDLVGLSRHPLILSSYDDNVTVAQAVLEEPEESFEIEGTPGSVIEAAGILLTSTEAGNAIQARSAVARVMAFNADRLTTALDFYCASSAIGRPANVLLPSDISVIAHCIAVALHESERNGMNHEMYLRVETDVAKDAARARAAYAIDVCDRALEKGCKVAAKSLVRALTREERVALNLPEPQRNMRIAAFAFQALQKAETEENARINLRVAAFNRMAAPQQSEVLKEMIDEVRQAQRSAYMKELENLTLSCVQQDFQRFSERVGGQQLSTMCTNDDEYGRRIELKDALEHAMGKPFPKYTGVVIPTCAYDAVLVCAGTETFEAYYQKCGALRIAQRRLFDATGTEGDMCDITDTGLICLTHDTVRSAQLFSSYMLFDHLSQALIGSPEVTSRFASVDMTKMYTFVHTKHGPTRQMPQLPWATDETTGTFWGWGSPEDRIVIKEVVRLLEELLLQQDLSPGNQRNFNWANQQRLFKDLAGLDPTDKKAPDGKARTMLTGEALVEKMDWQGELAAEVMSILWRNIHRNEHAAGEAMVPGGVERMPALPSIDDFNNFKPKDIRSFKYFESDFPMPADGSPQIEYARCYLRRLLYTSFACTWYLHAPISVCMFNSWHKAANNDTFVSQHSSIRNDDGSAAVLTDDWSFSTVAPLYSMHRQAGLDIADGTMEARAHNVNSVVEQRLSEVAVPATAGRPGQARVTVMARRDGTYVRPTKMLNCGEAFNAEAYGIITFRTLYAHKIKILTAGIGFILWKTGVAYVIWTKLGEWTGLAAAATRDAAGNATVAAYEAAEGARQAGGRVIMDGVQGITNATLGEQPAQVVEAGRGVWNFISGGRMLLVRPPGRAAANATLQWMRSAPPAAVPGQVPPAPPLAPPLPFNPPAPAVGPAIGAVNLDIGTGGVVGERMRAIFAAMGEAGELGAPAAIGANASADIGALAGDAIVDPVEVLQEISVMTIVDAVEKATGAYSDPAGVPGSNHVPMASYAMESSGFALLGQTASPRSPAGNGRVPGKRELRALLDNRVSASDRARILRAIAPGPFRRGAFEIQSQRVTRGQAAAAAAATAAAEAPPAPVAARASTASLSKNMHMLSMLDKMAPRPLLDPMRKRVEKQTAKPAGVPQSSQVEAEEVDDEPLVGPLFLFESCHGMAHQL